MNRLFFLLITLVISTSCVEEKSASQPLSLEQVEEFPEERIDTVNDPIEVGTFDISGTYELIQGETKFIGSDDDEIYKAEIIITRLSDTDYGFYSAYKVKNVTPVDDFGVFRNEKQHFNILGICEEEELVGTTNVGYTSGVYLHNRVIMKKKGDTLAMIRYGGNFRRYMLYKKKKPETTSSIYLVKALEIARYDYGNFLSKYENAINYDTGKLRIENKLVNDTWMTKHTHTEHGERFENTHYYQSPYEDGMFVQEDAVFMNLLNQ